MSRFSKDAINAGDLKEPVTVQSCTADDDGNYSWTDVMRTWAKVEVTNKTNLFSAVGIGARDVVLTMRYKKWMTLHHAIVWKGQHLFITSIEPLGINHMTVHAAMVEVCSCQASMETGGGITFPGVLREKHVVHQALDPQDLVTLTYVLVTPKAVSLQNGSIVKVTAEKHSRRYHVLLTHELDDFKNEYEIEKKVES